MKIQIHLPDKVMMRDTCVINEELRCGVKKKLEKAYRKSLNKRYKPFKIPICCEFCRFIGESMWHCHNLESVKYGINVWRGDVCSKWQPNSGLLMFLHARYLEKKLNDF